MLPGSFEEGRVKKIIVFIQIYIILHLDFLDIFGASHSRGYVVNNGGRSKSEFELERELTMEKLRLDMGIEFYDWILGNR